MRLFASIFLVGVVLVSWGFAAKLLEQGGTGPSTQQLETDSANVVRIRIHRARGAEATAAGLFVGKDQMNAYFITACHAVITDCNEGTAYEGIAIEWVRVTFYTSSLEFNAAVFARFEPALDLAVVQVPVTNLPPALPQIVKRDATLGAPIIVIGHPVEGKWVPSYGRIRNLNTPSDETRHFTTAPEESFSEGDSGGPVFDSDGSFLGMHTAATAQGYGLAAKSTEIVNQLKAWRVPSTNLQEPITPAPVGPSQGEIAINRVLDGYEDAHNSRRIEALWSVWATSSPQTKKDYAEYFKNARSITLRITNRRTEISSNGLTATVNGQLFQDFIPKVGAAPPPQRGPIIFKLEKRKEAWTIVSID